MKTTETAKVISMITSPLLDGQPTASCGGQGCRVYVLPFIELRPWDGNRKNTERKAA